MPSLQGRSLNAACKLQRRTGFVVTYPPCADGSSTMTVRHRRRTCVGSRRLCCWHGSCNTWPKEGRQPLLRWWASKLKVPFPLDDTQGTALGPAHVLAMAGYLNRAPGTARAFIAWTLLTTLACLCFAHVQRSTDLRIQGSFLVGLCTNGKRRTAGTRAPFRWAAPAEQLKDSRSIKLIRYGNKVGKRLATSYGKWFPLCARKIAEAFAEALRLRKLLQKLFFLTPPNPERKLMEMEGS